MNPAEIVASSNGFGYAVERVAGNAIHARCTGASQDVDEQLRDVF
jgi:hypothetical protein